MSKQTPAYVRLFDEGIESAAIVGGKGASLVRLAVAGLPVPAGFIRDPTAVDPADVVPVTWRPLITRSGRLLGTQAALDLDLDLNLNHIADAGGFAA